MVEGGRHEKGDFAYLVSSGLLVQYRVYFLEGGRVRLYDCQQLREEENLSILFPGSVRPGVTTFPTTVFRFSVTWHAKELHENVVGEQGSRY